MPPPCTRHRLKNFTALAYLTLTPALGGGSAATPVLQMRALRPREYRCHARGTTGREQWNLAPALVSRTARLVLLATISYLSFLGCQRHLCGQVTWLSYVTSEAPLPKWMGFMESEVQGERIREWILHGELQDFFSEGVGCCGLKSGLCLRKCLPSTLSSAFYNGLSRSLSLFLHV